MSFTKRILSFFALGCALAVVLLVAASFAFQEVSWRITVLREKLSAQLPEIPSSTLIRWMLPGSPVYVGQLAEFPNPNASITNPFIDAHTADAGVRVYGRQCVECHGEN